MRPFLLVSFLTSTLLSCSHLDQTIPSTNGTKLYTYESQELGPNQANEIHQRSVAVFKEIFPDGIAPRGTLSYLCPMKSLIPPIKIENPIAAMFAFNIKEKEFRSFFPSRKWTDCRYPSIVKKIGMSEVVEYLTAGWSWVKGTAAGCDIYVMKGLGEEETSIGGIMIILPTHQY